ncbi:MAG: FGGY-family carbohydrate kinase [Firmicutes bacterium]|nr:FGGY-family carbohydrate kinase [Bacillota bacterium]
MRHLYFLGADIGTTAIKAALFDENGRKLLHHVEEYELIKDDAQRVEQIPHVYWDTFKTSVQKVVSASGVDPADIKAFAMDSSAETIVFMDKEMNPLDNFYVWLDSRAVEEAEEINGYFPPEVIMKATGQAPIDPCFPAAKIAWFRRHKPELFPKIHMMFMCDDYLLWKLSGKKIGHGSSWCTSYLWNITTKDWWPEMMNYLGITPAQLPKIVESGTPVGKILPHVADELGLPHDLLLVVGGQDQSSGALGVGNVAPGVFSESTGGALMVCTTTNKPVFDPNCRIPCNYSIMKDIYMIQAGAKGGILLRWFRDTFCQEELGLEKAGGGDAYVLMDQLAAATPAGAEGLFLLPFFGGAGNPYHDNYARGVLYGLSLGHTKGHVIRAFMEALACNITKIIEYTEKLTGVKVTQVRSLGGGSKSPLWCQIKADVMNREVVTMKNTQDAACLGAAIIAGYGYGAWDSIAGPALKFAEIDRVYKPNPANREVYDLLLKKWDVLIDALDGHTERLARLK